jgi:hypothetical protein
MDTFKVPVEYLYIHEEVKELTGPALKDEKIIYKDQEMNYYHLNYLNYHIKSYIISWLNSILNSIILMN